jgi:hypothetical protein
LVALQERQKWLQPSANVSEGDVVLVMDGHLRNSWSLARVTKLMGDKKGIVRVVEVKMASNVLCRPTHKLCMLLESDTTYVSVHYVT